MSFFGPPVSGRAPRSPTAPPAPLPFHYGWVIVATSFLTTLIAAGVRSSPSVLIHPLETEFGWNRAAIASAISVNLFLYGAAAPLSGWLLDRYGPRQVMLGSLALIGIGVSGTIFMTELWQLIVLWGVVVGLGAGGGSSVLSATVAQRWFVARRGLVLGILNSASSTGQLIFFPLLMAIIVHSGWRGSSVFLVGICLAMLLAVSKWMKNDPANVGLLPYGAQEPAPEQALRLRAGAAGARPQSEISFPDVLRTPTFWLLCASFFVCGGTANGLVGTHLIPHSIDHGIPEITAAATIGVMGGMNFVGTLISGWLTDRVNPRKLLALVYALRGSSLFILPFVTDFSHLFVFAVVYGLDWFATVPPTIALAADAFGKRAIGRVYGWIFLAHQIGAALSAIGGGLIRVWLGDYHLAFIIGGFMGIIAAAIALSIPRPRAAARALVPQAAAP
ncbi:MAG TPA: MFS transporter [Candidatus Acidoferrales bacterium]|nr:MFS transporter [Candidatus Acidoferrales bacterium]